MSTAKITLGLKVTLILCHVGAAVQCSVSVSQPPYLEVDYTHGAVTLQCSFATSGCPSEPPTSLWFRYGARQSESLCVTGCQSDKFTESKKLATQQVFLTVNRAAPNDSAIYICGIAFPASGDPGAKRTGNGTLLVVRALACSSADSTPQPCIQAALTNFGGKYVSSIDNFLATLWTIVSKENNTKILSKTVRSLLAAVLALLSAYIIGVGAAFLVLSRTKSKCQRSTGTKDSQKKTSVRRIFQEIAQELYTKRHMETRHPPEKDDTYENRSMKDQRRV